VHFFKRDKAATVVICFYHCVCNACDCVNEAEAHPFFSNSKLIEFSQRNGIQVTAYSPLGKPTRSWYVFFSRLLGRPTYDEGLQFLLLCFVSFDTRPIISQTPEWRPVKSISVVGT